MRDANESVRLTFAPDARVVLHDENTVEIRIGIWHASSVTLCDANNSGVLGKIVARLASGNTAEGIAQDIGIPVSDVVEAISRLEEARLLVTCDEAAQWNRIPYMVASTLGANGMRKTAEQPRVRIIGPGYATETVIAALGPLAQRLDIVTEAAQPELRHSELFAMKNGLEVSTAADAYASWRDDVVVAVMPRIEPILASNLNRLAHLVGFTFLIGGVDGPFAIVGPTVIPQKTACFACAESRVIEALRDHTVYTRYKDAVLRGGELARPEPFIDPFQSTVYALIAWEIVNIVHTGTAFTANKIETIFGPTMETTFHELLRLPGCRVCGAAEGLGTPPYSDIMALLSSHLEKTRQVG